jgi:hypothetical protein
MIRALSQLYRSLPFAITISLCLLGNAHARRSIPDDNLVYPVLIMLNNGDTGSGFYLDTGTTLYLVTAKHVFFDPDTHTLRGEQVDPQTHNVIRNATAELSSYSANINDPTPIIYTADLSDMLKSR